jgi:hypothetical protein
MIGRAIRKGEQFDTDALLGQSYQIMVSNTPEDERGRVYDNVENVHAIRSKVDPKPQKVEEPDDAEKDFDEIPWYSDGLWRPRLVGPPPLTKECT